MNNSGMRMTLALGLLALVTAPAQAERYIVEPITDSADAAEEQGFSQAELDQILAPIALYPDSLLSQVLIAATYPLEIVEAARWSRQNPHLEGEAAVEAVAEFDWDPSVKALVAFPDLLAQMDEDLQWTRSLGDAMLHQEEQVMDSVQFLRARADSAGHLETNEYARVIREEETIIIEPAQTRVVHVPYYDPHVVYGTWWRPAYPPVYWTAPAYYHYGYPGFYWSPGIYVSSGFFYSSFYWPHRSVVIVHTPRFHHPHRHRSARHHFTPGQRWKHDPWHRRGVDYRHRDVRQRFDQPRLRAGPVTRWPLESGGARTERGTRERSAASGQAGSRSGSGSQWRDRSTAASGSDGGSGASARTGGETRLSAGPRTLRPSVAGTEERLRGTRADTRQGAAAPQQSASWGQRATAPLRQSATSTQRSTTSSRLSATQTERSTTSSRQSAAPPPQASTMSRGSITQSQRATARGPRATDPAQRTSRPAAAARAPSGSNATAPAPARQSRATNRGSGGESQAAPGSQREARGSDNSRGGSGRLGRRIE